jgi:hypothetical protein
MDVLTTGSSKESVESDGVSASSVLQGKGNYKGAYTDGMKNSGSAGRVSTSVVNAPKFHDVFDDDARLVDSFPIDILHPNSGENETEEGHKGGRAPRERCGDDDSNW